MSKINMFGYFDTKGNKKCPYKDLVSDRGISEKVFYFPDGLPGFKENKEFAFVFTSDSSDAAICSSATFDVTPLDMDWQPVSINPAIKPSPICWHVFPEFLTYNPHSILMPGDDN